ncbi:MAG: hypothetical protein V4608_03760 [Bacteroidota bacterium]
MSLLKKISFSCKEATLIAIQREEYNTTFFKKLKLFIHMAYCAPCRLFVKQTKIISRAVINYQDVLFANPHHKLSAEAKETIQNKINNTI